MYEKLKRIQTKRKTQQKHNKKRLEKKSILMLFTDT